MLDRLYVWIQKIEEGALIIAMALIVLLMALQVFTRYVVKMPVPWSAELGTFCLVWMVFLGAAIGARRGRHVKVETLISRCPAGVQYVVQLVIHVGLLVILAILAYFGFIRAQMSSSSILPATGIPMNALMLSVSVASVLMFLHYALAFYLLIRPKLGGESS
ncbi:TRAP transporter small permease subunit [candidate division KSB3 bacterium]|uniref:TRAP transporter small permease subunit n=1 Tax=candidate division KSB3 bacterium TaxID=2044937 RepID=A0A9D5JUD6_9BACT|nr:TRAP transporter small permease subunit [candidate division KSB3 bacterium]MBD3324171.1 TRAP transporter small permease subunit [candidate division KSB3 bacterium]